jgi:hypothetical protein
MNNNIFTQDLRKILPQKIYLTNDAGEWDLNLGDVEKTFPRLQVVYHHSTPEKTGNVLSDGEPDFLGFDIHFLEEGQNGERLNLNVDITYGDAMMFSFKMMPPNQIKVGHYNGYGSKFDPKSQFYFKEDSINDIMNVFQRINPTFQFTRDKFNFLDGDKNSFKMEKVRWISDFRRFNLLNRP